MGALSEALRSFAEARQAEREAMEAYDAAVDAVRATDGWRRVQDAAVKWDAVRKVADEYEKAVLDLVASGLDRDDAEMEIATK
jgi:C4-dicarboxylate-specific signal transduction histidine kinase